MLTILPFTFNNVKVVSYLLEILTNLTRLLLNSNAVIYYFPIVFNTFNPAFVDTTITEFIQIEAIGQNIYTYGAVLLIISSVILLLAMIAPIFISRPIKR